MTSPLALAAGCLVAAAIFPSLAPPPLDGFGHSKHGSAFDSGMRQRPFTIAQIGVTHFPITVNVADATVAAEVQQWFDHGNTLLHNFWFEEAERSFRWCLKLDPECAMAFWGLARTGLTWFVDGQFEEKEFQRYRDFLAEAVRRKAKVSPRERAYVEAWAAAYRAGEKDPQKRLAAELQKVVIAHPDDVEAKALLALFSIRKKHAVGNELLLQQVFARAPDHPGAHHYRIHTWDRIDPAQALESCRRYGPAAPGSGHANHMPGHIYSKVGMWHEAARSMDRATRIELAYMSAHLALPFESWNFAHNRNYLCHIQEQLGMETAARAGARDLIAAPRDPEKNTDGKYGDIDQGMKALVRGLLRFERWEEILKPGAIPWRERDEDRDSRSFAEAVALLRTGKLEEARARAATLRKRAAGVEKGDDVGGPLSLRASIVEGLVRDADGDRLGAVQRLTQAGEYEDVQRSLDAYENDPHDDPWSAWLLLGDLFRRHADHRLAVAAYERALKALPDDAFALSGLALSRAALGERDAAKQAAGRFAQVWSAADPGLRWPRELAALKLGETPVAAAPASERPYTLDANADVGPLDWEPFAAPELDVTAADGTRVRLADFRGRNVLLVFFLGEECAHCVEQLKKLDQKAKAGGFGDAVLLAVSSAPPEKNRASEQLGTLAFKLLSDTPDHANARRFASYDDFEELELHSTIVLDAKGRVHWKRTGGDPFMDVEFLAKAFERLKAPATP
jgi:peroxiredoxin/cytochrome c-type biogenesis protein CcmH/NrfG